MPTVPPIVLPSLSLARTLLHHIARLTAERRRPQLEMLLANALRELAVADTASIFKLQSTVDEPHYWLAAQDARGESRLLDDGISVPQAIEPLAQFADAQRVVLSGEACVVETAEGIRLLHPIRISGAVLGFAVIDGPPGTATADSVERQALVATLLDVFGNLMTLLDYSEVDTLTNLLNRKTFDEHLIQVLSRVESDDDSCSRSRAPRRRHAAPVGTHWLGVIDIDHFKRINDTHGHLIGDEVLLMVANLMRATFRFRDKLFRFGGEEFVIVLKPTTVSQVQGVFDRFRTVVANHRFPQVGTITVSTGYAPIRLGNQPSVIMHQADQALYWAKANGRNTTAGYESLVADGYIPAYVPPDSEVELF